MPHISGIEVLQQIRRIDKTAVIIIITAYGTVDNAVEACQMGANDYLTKPFSREQLLFALEKAVKLNRLEEENKALRVQLTDKFHFDNMVAKSALMNDVLRTAMQAAASDSTLLITGESGTGKELVCRGIHYNSPRKNQPFIVVNCPSIPDSLIESELFGHVRGAFTGAVQGRIGKFEQADGGTIFLDEIADLSVDTQAKLLRALQEKEIQRVGGNKTLKVDVRVIAATNKNMENLVAGGKFREDLYYRLSVIPIVIPPLRDRKEDIPFLVDYFVERYTKNRGITIDRTVIHILENYNWPGNIRELENTIERMVTLSTGLNITVANIPRHIQVDKPPEELSLQAVSNDVNMSLYDLEKNAIIQALAKTNGNRSKAARLLKIPRHVLLYRLKKYKIK
jgi:two-component system NtrC family response regulator